MEEASYGALLAKVSKEHLNTLDYIELIRKNHDSIGVTHFLVQNLYKINYLELEFYIPQFIQLLISFETDSMALTDFLIENSKKYPHFCLITFWYLQSYMFELKDSPDSYSFHVVRSFINDIQNIMFNQERNNQESTLRFRENTHPALVLAGSIAGSFAVPGMESFIRPIIISQSKQQKSFLFRLANFHKTLTRNLTLKNRVMSSEDKGSDPEVLNANSRHSEGSRPSHLLSSSQSINEDMTNSLSDTELLDKDDLGGRAFATVVLSKRRSEDVQISLENSRRLRHGGGLASHSLPDLTHNDSSRVDDLSITPVMSNSSSLSIASLDTSELRGKGRASLDADQKIKHLQVNYFKKETEFIMSLQNISSRLSQIPKEARLTTLRAELSIINNTVLPSEIDIPQLLPISSQQNKKFHQILRLNVNEAFVLNSAERVPFLLLIEYLSEEMDFNPQSDHNKNIIANKFQTDVSTSRPLAGNSISMEEKLQEEEDLGDMSMLVISNERNMMAHQLGPIKMDSAAQISPSSPKVGSSNTPNAFDSDPSTKDLSAQMRIAAVMLRQLEKSGQANSEQAAAIKARIIDSMKGLQDKFENIKYQQINEINSVNIGEDIPDAGERKMENDFKLGEDWQTKKDRIRKASAFGHLRNWELCSVIAKNGDDLPQEAFACQLISIISKIWKQNSVGVWTKNMKILVTSANSGLVETINNAMSIHSIKKSLTELSVNSGENSKGIVVSLKDYFLRVYGSETSNKYKRAQNNFACSLASYSIICYVLQIKDRHNGNIMLDNEGHIIHIDFGFLLSNSPGSVGFEAAPFKLTQEYVDVLGGFDSPSYMKFKNLCKESFQVLRRNCNQIIDMVELMSKDSSLPCFKNGSQTSILLKQRLQLDLSEEDCDSFVENSLIGRSIGSVYTRLYDQFQLITQGIYA
ncbi:phosphatidylinositol 4-kinase Pik1p [[Candida] jaroonii]|uniref:Phosphatidylinositol 4-kinase Pik1p n=1 Tax=[Candida] jaroonii TaxID=467808 RepID=A0ACA9Y1I6_9ASCO|nr:phosphatidylinositol 4-kinase Pik1p [[Candida] jaroonii]